MVVLNFFSSLLSSHQEVIVVAAFILLKCSDFLVKTADFVFFQCIQLLKFVDLIEKAFYFFTSMPSRDWTESLPVSNRSLDVCSAYSIFTTYSCNSYLRFFAYLSRPAYPRSSLATLSSSLDSYCFLFTIWVYLKVTSRDALNRSSLWSLALVSVAYEIKVVILTSASLINVLWSAFSFWFLAES